MCLLLYRDLYWDSAALLELIFFIDADATPATYIEASVLKQAWDDDCELIIIITHLVA